MLRHMGPPMVPTPINPTFMFSFPFQALTILSVIPSEAAQRAASRGTSSCRRDNKNRSLRCASLRSAPVGMTGIFLAPPSPHLEYQLALQMTRLADPQRLLGLRQVIERDMRLADGP